MHWHSTLTHYYTLHTAHMFKWCSFNIWFSFIHMPCECCHIVLPLYLCRRSLNKIDSIKFLPSTNTRVQFVQRKWMLNLHRIQYQSIKWSHENWCNFDKSNCMCCVLYPTPYLCKFTLKMIANYDMKLV